MNKEDIITKLKSIKKGDTYIKQYIDLFEYFLKQDFQLNRIGRPERKTKDDIVIEYIAMHITYFIKIYTRNNDVNNYIPDTWSLNNDNFFVNNIRKNRDKVTDKIKLNIIQEMKNNPKNQAEAKLHKHWAEHYYSCEASMFIATSGIVIDFDTWLVKKNKYL